MEFMVGAGGKFGMSDPIEVVSASVVCPGILTALLMVSLLFLILRASPMQSPTADVEERDRDLFIFQALEKRREVGQARVPGLANCSSFY